MKKLWALQKPLGDAEKIETNTVKNQVFKSEYS